MSGEDAGESPFVVARVAVVAVERVSPTFARVTFGGPALDEVGDVGRVFDQRIKLVFPSPAGVLPDLVGGADWYATWLALPEESRGPMRTYSIRELQVGPAGTRVVVDFVLHLAPGLSGPAARWADAARPGDELVLVGPRRGRSDGSGVEYAPADAGRVVLAGDETAAPAIARILEDCAPDVRGVAFVEVPVLEDAVPIAAPPGVEVRWLPRSGRPHGEALIPAVLDHLGAGAGAGGPGADGGGRAAPGGVDGTSDGAGDGSSDGDVPAAPPRETDEGPDGDDLVWETPRHSGRGDPLPAPRPAGADDCYFWIAGESGVVTVLRRHLVRDWHVDRSRVAFMGYWRTGVAMRG